ncbi:Golgi apparatus membrane protein tvp38 isoform X2 [Beta vulgaris subsp. vulgaris]|uniref:Golgi apparatus membrane protein tvp38 isoform X2 n=1 Tax=Beta vulgaris subsp. vulgaris TaxID=3555 RepID=UPI002036F2B0|nr:Golgi apparatus membrane protein tvp38 isoform X2 [Beta vulgaris subsp. vulgaris]
MQEKLNKLFISETKATKMEVIKSDYQILDPNSTSFDEESPLLSNYAENNCNSHINWRWKKRWFIILLGVVIAVSAIVIIKQFGPSFMKKEVMPVINWLIETFSSPVLAAILFAGIALFPVLLLPTTPFKWIAGMTFGYGICFLVVIPGVAVGVSLPYFIAYKFRDKKWLDNHPEKAAIVRLAGDGEWLHQFQAIALVRLTPFPYVVLNYAAVATGVKYGPYLTGTLVGMAPEILLAIYSGKLFRTVAEAMEEDTHVSKFHMIFDGMGFCLTAVSTIAIGFYSKRKLKQLQELQSNNS